MRAPIPFIAFIVVGCASPVGEFPLIARSNCVNPTVEEARAGRPVRVDVWITGLGEDGTLRADQIGCPKSLNIAMRGHRPDLDRLRTLFREGWRRSDDARMFVVTARLSGTLAVSPPFPGRDGPADVTLNVVRASDGRIVERKVR